MKDSGLMDKDTDMECFIMQMAPNMKENGSII